MIVKPTVLEVELNFVLVDTIAVVEKDGELESVIFEVVPLVVAVIGEETKLLEEVIPVDIVSVDMVMVNLAPSLWFRSSIL